MAKGYQAAKKFHDENTGMPYSPIKIKDGQTLTIRILQSEDEWVSLYFHEVVNKLKRTRCASETPSPDAEKCALCAHDAPRRYRTFIPMRVRGDENLERVVFQEVGREGLAMYINQIEELPEGKNMTMYDWKLKRTGEKLSTTYHIIKVEDPETQRPLNDAEKSLNVPNLEELYVVPDAATILARAMSYSELGQVTATGEAGKSKTPF